MKRDETDNGEDGAQQRDEIKTDIEDKDWCSSVLRARELPSGVSEDKRPQPVQHRLGGYQ
jgi:hypothetical protein